MSSTSLTPKDNEACALATVEPSPNASANSTEHKTTITLTYPADRPDTYSPNSLSLDDHILYISNNSVEIQLPYHGKTDTQLAMLELFSLSSHNVVHMDPT